MGDLGYIVQVILFGVVAVCALVLAGFAISESNWSATIGWMVVAGAYIERLDGESIGNG